MGEPLNSISWDSILYQISKYPPTPDVSLIEVTLTILVIIIIFLNVHVWIGGFILSLIARDDELEDIENMSLWDLVFWPAAIGGILVDRSTKYNWPERYKTDV